MNYRNLLSLACLLLVLAVPRAASADTLTVTSAADHGPGTLREAVARAKDGDVVVFTASMAGDTIELEDRLVFEHAITVDASALPDTLTITGSERPIFIRANARFVGLRIARCFEGAVFRDVHRAV